jgi:hypothetical protein
MVGKNIFPVIAILIIAAALVAGCTTNQPGGVTPTPTPTVTVAPKMYTQAEADLILGMRKLWTDHAVWTRMYIIESLDDSPATGAAATRLLQNQVDIGNAIKPVYGDAAGTQLTALLNEHILIAVDIVNAVKAQNTTAQAAAEAKWTQNADEIAAFLASANPNWPEPVLRDLMHTHLSTTKAELVARYTGNTTADVQAFKINLWDNIKASNRCGKPTKEK